MSPLEFTIIAIYLSFFFFTIVMLHILEAARLQMRAEDTEEKFVEATETVEQVSSEEEEQESAEESPFNPETESYTMTENPMLRHRVVPQELDMDAVD